MEERSGELRDANELCNCDEHRARVVELDRLGVPPRWYDHPYDDYIRHFDNVTLDLDCDLDEFWWVHCSTVGSGSCFLRPDGSSRKAN